jgi:hypothetical protein
VEVLIWAEAYEETEKNKNKEGGNKYEEHICVKV